MRQRHDLPTPLLHLFHIIASHHWIHPGLPWQSQEDQNSTIHHFHSPGSAGWKQGLVLGMVVCLSEDGFLGINCFLSHWSQISLQSYERLASE